MRTESWKALPYSGWRQYGITTCDIPKTHPMALTRFVTIHLGGYHWRVEWLTRYGRKAGFTCNQITKEEDGSSSRS